MVNTSYSSLTTQDEPTSLSRLPIQTLVYHVYQIWVFQCGCNTLLVSKLFVDRCLTAVTTLCDSYIHLCVQRVSLYVCFAGRHVHHGVVMSAHMSNETHCNYVKCVCGHHLMHSCLISYATLKRGGSACMSLTRRHKPINVAMLQCCTVGVNSTLCVNLCVYLVCIWCVLGVYLVCVCIWCVLRVCVCVFRVHVVMARVPDHQHTHTPKTSAVNLRHT